MKIGVHISIAGGFENILQRAKERECATIQIFSRNPRGWTTSSLTVSCKETEEFKKNLKNAQISPLIIHLPYLPNLASPKKELYLKSIDLLISDLKQAEILEAPYLIVHMGSHGGTGEKIGLKNVAEAINTAFTQVDNQVTLLLENTAGEKNELGYDFNQIREVIEQINLKNRIGLCLDTAHAFEAGYDISTLKGIEETLNIIDQTIGREKIKVLHINDSKTSFNSHVDRHTHIGEGYIGLDGFRNIINHPKLKDIPMILETPVLDSEDDWKNIRTLRNLAF